MKTFRLFYTRVALSLVLASMAGFGWWGVAPAHAVPFSLATMIPVAGIVSDPTAASETVAFGGLVGVSTALVLDPTFGAAPVVIIALDLSGVTGIGVASKSKYVAGLHPQFVRDVGTTDILDITFPFSQNGATMITPTVRNGAAKIALQFNPTTGVVTGGAGIIASPAP